jgi:HAD superfamily hydrolase (TIGR01509 family)
MDRPLRPVPTHVYDAVVLDSDGVLVGLSGRETLAAAVDRTYRAFGVRPDDEDRAALWVGTDPERVRAAARRHGLDPEAVWTTRDRTVSRVERAAIRAGEKPLHADAAALDRVDVPLAVASNNLRTTVAAVLDGHGLRDRVASVRAREPRLASLADRKPAPTLLNRALADLGVAPDRTLFVGDGATDVEAAARAGVDAALLARPDHDPVEGVEPRHTIATLADLPDIVEG